VIKVEVNRETCEGYANCVRADASVFDLDDDDTVTLKQELVSDDRIAQMRRAVYDCPTDSISIVEDVEEETGR
jgi:ferredoxin